MENETQIIWSKPKMRWSIVYDEHGFGITDRYYIDRPTVYYPNKKIEYENSERLPQYIKDVFERLVKKDKIKIKNDIEIEENVKEA